MPSLEIAAPSPQGPRNAPPAAAQPGPPGQGPAALPPVAPRPAPAATAEARIVEERIDISIGTIRLEVTPPPAAAARRAALAPPAPEPRPAAPPADPAGRLRRRYVRL